MGGRSTLILLLPWTLRRRYQHGVPACLESLLKGPRSVQERLEKGIFLVVSELDCRVQPETLGACLPTKI